MVEKIVIGESSVVDFESLAAYAEREMERSAREGASWLAAIEGITEEEAYEAIRGGDLDDHARGDADQMVNELYGEVRAYVDVRNLAQDPALRLAGAKGAAAAAAKILRRLLREAERRSKPDDGESESESAASRYALGEANAYRVGLGLFERLAVVK